MKRNNGLELLAALVLVAGGAAAQDRVVNVYNWSDYIDEERARRVHRGDRHQGRLRRLRLQRDPRNQAARRRHRLRHRRAERQLPVAPDQGRHAYAARQVEAPEPGTTSWPAIMRAAGQLRPGQPVRRQLHVGHHGHRHTTSPRSTSACRTRPSTPGSMLFQPENAAKLADCGIYLLDAPEDVIPATLELPRQGPEFEGPGRYSQKAGRVLKAIRPYIQQVPLLGEHQRARQRRHLHRRGWSGDACRRRDRAKEANNGVEIEYRIPKEGAQMWFDMMAMPKDAPQSGRRADIHQLSCCEPQVIAKANPTSSPTPTRNPASKPFIDKAILDDPTIYPPPGGDEQAVPRHPLRPEGAARRHPAMAEALKAGR